MARTWLTARSEYQDFPIHFRRPDVRVAEFEALRPAYPRLLILTHRLAKVRENGLPEARYNDALASLDAWLTAPFDDETNGIVALIETYAGKRIYYVYVVPAFDAAAYAAAARTRFPDEDLTHEVDDDPGWRLFKGYARDFDFP